MPVLSVCVPTFNAAPTLAQTLQSALDQDFSDFDLVVCDDGSTDDTPAVLSRFSDSRLKVERFSNGGSQGANFNRCLELMSGEFGMLLHSDDWLFPGFLRNRVEKLQSNPKLVLVGGAIQKVDGAGQTTTVSRHFEQDTFFPNGEFVLPLLKECVVAPVSMVFRVDAARKAGKFRTEFSWGPDWEWALRLAEQGAVFYDATPRAAYREHAGSGTASALKGGRNGVQERQILGEAFARLARNPHLGPLVESHKREVWWTLAKRHFWFAEQALQAQNGPVARQNLRFAARASKSALLRPNFWKLWAKSLAARRVS